MFGKPQNFCTCWAAFNFFYFFVKYICRQVNFAPRGGFSDAERGMACEAAGGRRRKEEKVGDVKKRSRGEKVIKKMWGGDKKDFASTGGKSFGRFFCGTQVPELLEDLWNGRAPNPTPHILGMFLFIDLAWCCTECPHSGRPWCTGSAVLCRGTARASRCGRRCRASRSCWGQPGSGT